MCWPLTSHQCGPDYSVITFLFLLLNKFVDKQPKKYFSSNLTQVLLPPLVVIINSELFLSQQGGLLTRLLLLLFVFLPPCFLERLPAELKAVRVYLSYRRRCCQRTCYVPASSSGRKEGRRGREWGKEERGKSSGTPVWRWWWWWWW